MADYMKVAVTALFSENADYTDAMADTHDWSAWERTGNYVQEAKIVAPTSGGAAANIGGLATFTGPVMFVLKNLDVSNAVTLVYKDMSGTTNTLRITRGGIAVIPNLDPTTTPTLVSTAVATVLCKVFAVGT